MDHEFTFEIGQNPVWLITQDGVVRTTIKSRGYFEGEDEKYLYKVVDPYTEDETYVPEEHLFEDFVKAAKTFYEAFVESNS